MSDDEELPRSSAALTGRLRAAEVAELAARTVGGDRSARVNGLRVILAAVLVAINAFFVIAEYALVRSRRARLELLRDEGAKGATLALAQLAQVNEYISAVQIGVTMTSIGIGALGEPALAALLKGALGNGWSHGVAAVIVAVVAFGVISAVQLIAGEMVPKFYAIDRAEAVARRVARPLQAFSVVFHPLIVMLTVVSNRLLEPARRGDDDRAPRWLLGRAQAADRGVPCRRHIDPGEAGMLTGVFHLHEQEARQVMTPIPAVATIDVSESVEAAVRLCVSSGHTRLS